MSHNLFNSLQEFQYGGKTGQYYSLPALEKAGLGKISRLPRQPAHRARIGAAQLRRQEDHRGAPARRSPAGSRTAQRTAEVPFVVARVLLQDMTGVPLVVDFAAMREAAQSAWARIPRSSSRSCPAHLIIDHSVQVDHYGSPDALQQEHGDRVHAQPRALRVPEVERAGVQDLRDRPARQRHLPPGQSRVRLARGVAKGRHVLSRQPRRHRFAHDDGQRPRRARLGRGRHRSRSRDARPADVLPRARRRRRAPDAASCAKASPRPTSCSPSPSCCARRRSSASSSSISAKARRRCRSPTARRSATCRPNTARPAASSRSTTSSLRVPAHDRPRRRRAERSKAYYKAQGMFGMPKKGEIDYSEVVELDLVDASSPPSPARAARTTASTCPTLKEQVRRS